MSYTNGATKPMGHDLHIRHDYGRSLVYIDCRLCGLTWRCTIADKVETINNITDGAECTRVFPEALLDEESPQDLPLHESNSTYSWTSRAAEYLRQAQPASQPAEPTEYLRSPPTVEDESDFPPIVQRIIRSLIDDNARRYVPTEQQGGGV